MAAATEVLGGAVLSPAKFNELDVGTTSPAGPIAGNTWIDTSVSGVPVPRLYGTGFTSYRGFGAESLLFEDTALYSTASAVADTALLTISGLNIGVTQQCLITFDFGCIPYGSGGNKAIGLTVNSTLVNSTAGAYLGRADFSGTMEIWIPKRPIANVGWAFSDQISIQFLAARVLVGGTAFIPAATITQFIIGGSVISGASSIGIWNTRVWEILG